jgi:hypothetical protein
MCGGFRHFFEMRFEGGKDQEGAKNVKITPEKEHKLTTKKYNFSLNCAQRVRKCQRLGLHNPEEHHINNALQLVVVRGSMKIPS